MPEPVGPWVITSMEPKNLDPRRLTWKDLAAVLASNVGHVALALHLIADGLKAHPDRRDLSA